MQCFKKRLPDAREHGKTLLLALRNLPAPGSVCRLQGCRHSWDVGVCVNMGTMWDQGEKPSPPALEITSLSVFSAAAGGDQNNNHCASQIPQGNFRPPNRHPARPLLCCHPCPAVECHELTSLCSERCRAAGALLKGDVASLPKATAVLRFPFSGSCPTIFPCSPHTAPAFLLDVPYLRHCSVAQN